MKKTIVCPQFKARLSLIRSSQEKACNWIFFPGGPGLGSESLDALTEHVHLPGTMWYLDLPNDGSYVISDDNYYFEQWLLALVEAVQALDTVILVAHSTGAMYALSAPALKDLLRGIVIMSSAPDARWIKGFMAYVAAHPLPEVQRLQKIYAQQPTDENLRLLTIASIPYLSASRAVERKFSFFEKLPYNARACEWSAQHFDAQYQAQWVPDSMPALIFTGDQDHITPLELFRHAQTFHHKNIVMHAIEHAGHYPWVENLDQVKAVFAEYCERLV